MSYTQSSKHFNAKKIKKKIQDGLDIAFAEEAIVPDVERELDDIYAPFTPVITPPSEITSEKRFVDAVQDGLKESMKKYDDLIIMGQDIAEYGGVFKITEGFSRVRYFECLPGCSQRYGAFGQYD